MVEHAERLDSIFSSLSDPTRRDILRRVSKRSASVGEIAAHYEISFAGIAKHVDVLERAGLVKKSRRGKEQVVAIAPKALAEADRYLEGYRTLWERRLDSLDVYLKTVGNKK